MSYISQAFTGTVATVYSCSVSPFNCNFMYQIVTLLAMSSIRPIGLYIHTFILTKLIGLCNWSINQGAMKVNLIGS